MAETVKLGVWEVRQEIYRAAGGAAGDGAASRAWLGRLFHEVFQRLMQPGTAMHWTNALDLDTLDGHERLRDQAWSLVVGPKLRQNQAGLQNASREVLDFWEAVGHLCQYICQLLKNSVEQKVLRVDTKTREWVGLEQFSVEEELSWRIEDPAWTAAVEVRGVADAVWRNPASRSWCVVDLKLGQGSREADQAQLCLYHSMIAAREGGGGQLALMHFKPQLERSTHRGEEVEEVRAKLIDLIGALAGVKGGGNGTRPTLEHLELGARLVEVLEQFGPMVKMESDPVAGPSFLRFHIMPGAGVKVKKILPLGEDLRVQLGLKKPVLVRSEGGRLLIDVERPDRQKLDFAEFRAQLPAPSAEGNSRMLVGVDLNRKPVMVDLSTESPHLLVAGTSGSGKSEWLLTALASLLASNTPETLRLMLIDPKRVTFQDLTVSPFLMDMEPLLHTPEGSLGALKRLIGIMEARYELFSQHGCSDLAGLRRVLGHKAAARIVCVCDEYGNLVAEKKHREKIELAIQQLGAKARAAGIHLVIATQDPRAQILSPTLKANLSGRVCLKTTSAVQSRMMLEENGAESLLGHGDLLFKTTGEAVRLQAPLLGQAEREELFGKFVPAG